MVKKVIVVITVNLLESISVGKASSDIYNPACVQIAMIGNDGSMM